MGTTIHDEDGYAKACKNSQSSEVMDRTHKINGTKVKEDIKENAIKITEEERKKANKIINSLKRDIETQNKRISNNATTENRKRARENFLFLKSSLKKLENEKLEREKESAQS